MEFQCEDLRQFGVVLVPPSDPEYDPLLADIQARLDNPVAGYPNLPERMRPRIVPEDRETSAILVNRSEHGIAAIQQIWSYKEWDLPEFDSPVPAYTSSYGPGGSPPVLLPYGISGKARDLYAYWHVILPGSKRYLGPNGRLVGDNTDVRQPAPGEVWSGGVGGSGGGTPRRSTSAVQRVTLTLDGVFFTDGGFAGPNQSRIWEQVVDSAEAHRELSRIATAGRDRGDDALKILADIATIAPPTDRPAPPHLCRESAMKHLGFTIALTRKHMGDEGTVQTIIDWGSVPVPAFHKL